MSRINKPRQDLAGQPEQVLKAALRYLGRREYSAAELSRQLGRRGAEQADIESALAYLQERGYQDDGRAAESHIRQRKQFAPRGRELIRHELRERGIGAELGETLLEQYYSHEDEQAMLRRLLERESASREAFAAAEAGERRRIWLKMARRLAAKGFEPALIHEELSQWLAFEVDEGE